MVITLNNDLSTMKVGEYVWCKYTATSGVIGTFSEFATKTDADVVGQEIPVASSATPNGYFKFIMVEDWNGKKRLVADRNIQHTISWDTLNTSGIASGSGLPIASISEQPSVENGFNRVLYAVRLLTGGSLALDTDSEWYNYIISSNLNETITSGDNAVWNWNGVYSWTSTTMSTNSTYRALRGNTAVNTRIGNVTSEAINIIGFRPVLEEYEKEFVLFNKTLILHEAEYKSYIGESEDTPPEISNTNAIPTMTSNTTPSGIASASTTLSGRDAYYAFEKSVVGASGGWSTSANNTKGWLSYRFTEPKVIGRYKLTLVNTAMYIARAPKDWTFEGSNDGNDWDVLHRVVSFNGFTTSNPVSEFNIDNLNPYIQYRINVTSNNGDPSYLQINDLEMYEVTKEGLKGSPAKWKVISNDTPTVNQFIEDGMNDLTLLFERKVMNLEPQVMNQDSTPVGNGKVYRKKVNLNKYFDIRTISTETRNN